MISHVVALGLVPSRLRPSVGASWGFWGASWGLLCTGWVVVGPKNRRGLVWATCAVSELQFAALESSRSREGCGGSAPCKLQNFLGAADAHSNAQLRCRAGTVADITLRQCQDDFDPERVSGVIQYLSKAHDGTRVVLDEPTLSYLTRSFCIFEVACTKPGKLCIDMSEDTSNMFLQGAFSIDAKAATSTSEKHKYLVDGYILGQWGSYRRFNESVSAAFRSAYRSQVEAEEEVSIE
eukprot:5771415-Pyramimonas_sp.AAC.1